MRECVALWAVAGAAWSVLTRGVNEARRVLFGPGDRERVVRAYQRAKRDELFRRGGCDIALHNEADCKSVSRYGVSPTVLDYGQHS